MTRRSDPASSPNQELQKRKRWVEPITALLTALATLSTAWCSYQSASWTRQSNRLMNEFNAIERREGLLCGLSTVVFFVIVSRPFGHRFKLKTS
jgi:uncharacterized membrane protein